MTARRDDSYISRLDWFTTDATISRYLKDPRRQKAAALLASTNSHLTANNLRGASNWLHQSKEWMKTLSKISISLSFDDKSAYNRRRRALAASRSEHADDLEEERQLQEAIRLSMENDVAPPRSSEDQLRDKGAKMKRKAEGELRAGGAKHSAPLEKAPGGFANTILFRVGDFEEASETDKRNVSWKRSEGQVTSRGTKILSRPVLGASFQSPIQSGTLTS